MPIFEGPEGRRLETDAVKPREILGQWGMRKGAVAVKVNGEIRGLDELLDRDAFVEAVAATSEEGTEIIRHSTSHLLAQAVRRLFPGTKVAIGPAIRDGFYYDMEIPGGISEDDLPRIEKEMRRIVKQALPLEHFMLPRQEALDLFEKEGETYKLELISELPDEMISVYRQGEYVDLCRGPHVPNTSALKHFHLLSMAGAYWRGDENNIMLTRIYGTAFGDKQSLEDHLKRLEEAKKRDHRKLGRDLDLFSLQPEGPGFPFFHPRGMVVRNLLIDLWRKKHREGGYSEIMTPLMLDRNLWVRSGHWDHYRDNMYFTEIDDQPFAVKPMNCPGGILVYKTQIRSYRDLPLRMAELGTVHRHERSGVLHGLMRVRCFTQDDAHLYVTPEQIKEEIRGVMRLDNEMYRIFGFKYQVELSTRPEDAMGDSGLWDQAEDALREALEEEGVPYRLNPGDGAFYGPKIDFHLEDCIGRTWQCGTIQLDFQMPEKFDISYIGSDGAQHRPVMLHRTIYGSLERFMGILIEHYGGAFPFWLAPEQIRILPVKEEFREYADGIIAELRAHGFRVESDTRDEKLGKKIRDAQIHKVPYMLVVGEREVNAGQVAVRERSQGDLGSMDMEAFLTVLRNEEDPLN